MAEQDPFGILEEKISNLMAAYEDLRKEKAALAEQIDEKVGAIRVLEEKVAHLSLERERVKEKVEALLGRLERLLVSSR